MQNVPDLRSQKPETVNYSTICYADTYMYSLFYRKKTSIPYTPNIHLDKLKFVPLEQLITVRAQG